MTYGEVVPMVAHELVMCSKDLSAIVTIMKKGIISYVELLFKDRNVNIS
jgi:hypothetical protein